MDGKLPTNMLNQDPEETKEFVPPAKPKSKKKDKKNVPSKSSVTDGNRTPEKDSTANTPVKRKKQPLEEVDNEFEMMSPRKKKTPLKSKTKENAKPKKGSRTLHFNEGGAAALGSGSKPPPAPVQDGFRAFHADAAAAIQIPEPEPESVDIDVTVQDVKSIPGEHYVKKTVTAKVIKMQPESLTHELVQRGRRKLCLADHTGFIIGFLKRDITIRFELHDTITVSNFKVKEGIAIFHNNTVLQRTTRIQLAEYIENEAQLAYSRPATPVQPIRSILRRQPGCRISVQGTVTATENYHTLNMKEKGEKLIREITVADETGEFEITLWENAALNCDLQLGQRIVVADCSLSYNKVRKHVFGTLNFPDLITILPPLKRQERVMVRAAEDTDNSTELEVRVLHDNLQETLLVDRLRLTRAFGLRKPFTVRELIKFLPFSAQTEINGRKITDISVMTVPTSAPGIVDGKILESDEEDSEEEMLTDNECDQDEDGNSPNNEDNDNEDGNSSNNEGDNDNEDGNSSNNEGDNDNEECMSTTSEPDLHINRLYDADQ